MRPVSRVLLTAACTAALALALPAAAGSQHDYRVSNLGSLGGTSSAGVGINNLGLVTGFSNLPGDQSTHATAWLFGSTFDLGTLGGANSAVVFPVKNNRGLIAGVAETGRLDPNGESWSCSAFFPTATHHTCLGVVWAWGHKRALPTLGGNNGFAAGINDLAQVVGWAETAQHDPTCSPQSDQVLQFLPVVWGPAKDQLRTLPLVEGDSSGSAVAINNHDQIVGISGDCDQAVGRFSARHAVMWDHGRLIALGDLGGTAWNTPVAINQRGDVVGFGNVPGGATPGSFHAHAFLWTRSGGMRDLGTLPGDTLSEALGINDRGQVVGLSFGGAAGQRAFLWENGVMVDLNTRIAPGYSDHLLFANDIDDAGRITGEASNGSAFVAVPVGW
jgi:probable HAF family extracellular repeat protein